MNIIYENGIIKTPDMQLGNESLLGVGSVLFKKMKIFSEKTAQIEVRTGKFDTFKTLLQKCVTTAIVLRQMGINKGDHVALCSDHHLNACVPLISGYFVGAIPFSLDPTQTLEECTHLLKQIQPKVMFVIKEVKQKIEQSLSKAGIPCTQIITFQDEFAAKFLTKQEGEETFTPIEITNLQEIATIYFSSGSTGLPKGICLSHLAVLSWCDSEGGVKYDELVYFNAANWYWASSGSTLIKYTVGGGCRLLVSGYGYTIDELCEWIDKYKITTMFLLYFHCIELTFKPISKKFNYSSLQTIFSGGSRVPTEYIEKIWNLFPGVKVLHGYGMTELLNVTGFVKETEEIAKNKMESIGLPYPGVWYKVVDPKTEEIVGPNQSGELRLKSKHIMLGYYKKDSSEVFDEDEWFKTGDLVHYDDDFCFYFVCRLKEGLNYQSQWVYPAQIEDILIQHPAVKYAVVIGKPHPIDEEHPQAVLVLNDGWKNRKNTEELLVNFVDEKVEDRNKLRGGVVFVDKFPLTITGKVNRFKLKEMLNIM